MMTSGLKIAENLDMLSKTTVSFLHKSRLMGTKETTNEFSMLLITKLLKTQNSR